MKSKAVWKGVAEKFWIDQSMNDSRSIFLDSEPIPDQPSNRNLLASIQRPLEIRVLGRGGQGGVTCAKLCALIYSQLGLFAQTFGDYGMERAGAPVRAYTRISRMPIQNRNKVYTPDHLLVLDPSLFGESALDGVSPGSLILLNTSREASEFLERYEQFRFATINASEIARRHGIGTSAVVIINTTIIGAYARLVDIPVEIVQTTYTLLNLQNDFAAAREAYESVKLREVVNSVRISAHPAISNQKDTLEIIALTDVSDHMAPPLKTGLWRSQFPSYLTRTAPCIRACPAGNDVLGFIQKLKTGDLHAAAQVLCKTQPLPSVCGRVCPGPCMMSCSRGGYDGAVNIRGLERWIGDHWIESEEDVEPCDSVHKIAIVGGGPAGLSAAFVLLRAGHDVTVYEGQKRLGGVLRTGIPAYRLPYDALERDIERILALGLKTKCGTFLDAQQIKALAGTHDALAVATGLASSKDLHIPGADLGGIEQGLEFLYRVKTGSFERLTGQIVVIGGGNTAIDCARTALRSGADKVTIVYRRGREDMPAIDHEVTEAISEGVDVVLHRQPIEFIGDGRVTGVKLAEALPGELDHSGRKRPVVTEIVSFLSCDKVLMAVGQYQDAGILPCSWEINSGRAYEGGDRLNVWLAGDITTGEGTVAHAIGHGRRVALDILAAIAEGGLSSDARLDEADVIIPPSIRFSHFETIKPNEDEQLPILERTSGFQEVNLGLPGIEEALRCFSCGNCTRCDTCLIYCPEGVIIKKAEGYAIDEDFCKGCGICATECPRCAMVMTATNSRS